MNTFISPSWVTTDTAMFWKNDIRFLGALNREYSNEFKTKVGGAKKGYTVQVRIPQRFTVAEGQALVQQPILNQTVPITVNHQQHVGMGWGSADSALVVEEVQSRYTSKAGKALANNADRVSALELYPSIYFSI